MTPPRLVAVPGKSVAPPVSMKMSRAEVRPLVVLKTAVPPLNESPLPAPVAPNTPSPTAAVPPTRVKPPLKCVPPVYVFAAVGRR